MVVGKGSLEAGRGIPLGRVGVLGCLSMTDYSGCIPEVGGRWTRDQGETIRELSVQNRSKQRSTQGVLCRREGKSKKQTWSQQQSSLKEFLFTVPEAATGFNWLTAPRRHPADEPFILEDSEQVKHTDKDNGLLYARKAFP